MNSICVLFHRLGPYHWARLNAVGDSMPTVALEISGETSEYAWDKVDGRKSFERVTLFPDRDSHKLPQREVARRVCRALDKHNPAAVALPGWAEKSSLAALAWCVKAGRPAILMTASQETDAVRHWSKEAVKRQLVGLCSGGLAGGAAQADYLAMLGMPRKRIFTGYDVVDNEHFSIKAEGARRHGETLRLELGLPENYFVASNRFIEKKNLFRLLEAFSSYRLSAGTNAWKLVLLGDGPLKGDLLKQRDQLGLAGDVILPGFKQYQELPTYYGLARAFVHASTVEQWGLVVNEAMASGLPVLVSDRCGCARDLVVNGKNGFTFNPLNVQELAALMGRISSHEVNLDAMAQASREIVGRWSPETFASSLRAAIEKARTEPTPKAGLINQIVLKALINS